MRWRRAINVNRALAGAQTARNFLYVIELVFFL